MQQSKPNTHKLVKSFGFIVFLGVIYLFLGSDESRTNEHGQEGEAVKPAIVRPPPTPLHTCRALFTISQVMHRHILQTSAHNRTHSEGVRGNEWVVGDSAGMAVGDREWWSAAAATVQQLLQKRTSPSGAPSSYYYSLAALLPKLLSFRDDSHYGEEIDTMNSNEQATQYKGEMVDKVMKQKNSPFFRERSRVASGGGVLPHVPCVIASYQQLAAVSHCVRRRLERTPQLWLYFMGDSKIRYLFTEFIKRTDSEFKYSISSLNVTEPWRTLWQKLARNEARWSDMEATTHVAPHLRISFSFKKFDELYRSEFNVEMAELRRWASGEPSPDLLVVGYSSWVIGARDLYHAQNNGFTDDMLDLLMERHTDVLPLLEQISRRSRVLVLPQSRVRPHSGVFLNQRGAFTDAIFDWSEMTFLHMLRRYRESHGGEGAAREDPSDSRDAGGNTEEDEHSGSQGYNNDPHRHTLPTEEAFPGELQSRRTSEPGGTPLYHPRANETRQRTTTPQEDQRSPGITDADPRPQETTEQTWTFQDPLVPTRSTSGLWWWDSSLPLNLAGILECNELYGRGLGSHPMYTDSVLRCFDAQHAGSATNSDLVTMLLNLLCNSVEGLHHNYCCT